MRFAVQELGPGDVALFEQLMTLFGDVFDERSTYTAARPPRSYVKKLLAREDFIVMAALRDAQVVGGLAAYVLHKFEQARSEVFIYDLAVAESHRRQGIATALLEATKESARKIGAYVVFVQADAGDDPAIALYKNFGPHIKALHFDIDVASAGDN